MAPSSGGHPVEHGRGIQVAGLQELDCGGTFLEGRADGFNVDSSGKTREPIVVVAQQNPPGLQVPGLANQEIGKGTLDGFTVHSGPAGGGEDGDVRPESPQNGAPVPRGVRKSKDPSGVSNTYMRVPPSPLSLWPAAPSIRRSKADRSRLFAS